MRQLALYQINYSLLPRAIALLFWASLMAAFSLPLAAHVGHVGHVGPVELAGPVGPLKKKIEKKSPARINGPQINNAAHSLKIMPIAPRRQPATTSTRIARAGACLQRYRFAMAQCQRFTRQTMPPCRNRARQQYYTCRQRFTPKRHNRACRWVRRCQRLRGGVIRCAPFKTCQGQRYKMTR